MARFARLLGGPCRRALGATGVARGRLGGGLAAGLLDARLAGLHEGHRDALEPGELGDEGALALGDGGRGLLGGLAAACASAWASAAWAARSSLRCFSSAARSRKVWASALEAANCW